jgi:hypothetical protein
MSGLAQKKFFLSFDQNVNFVWKRRGYFVVWRCIAFVSCDIRRLLVTALWLALEYIDPWNDLFLSMHIHPFGFWLPGIYSVCFFLRTMLMDNKLFIIYYTHLIGKYFVLRNLLIFSFLYSACIHLINKIRDFVGCEKLSSVVIVFPWNHVGFCDLDFLVYS